jgi:hypothetical protein
MSDQHVDPLVLRARRKQILQSYDRNSLEIAYKVTLNVPLTTDLSGLPSDQLIQAILFIEFPAKRKY